MLCSASCTSAYKLVATSSGSLTVPAAALRQIPDNVDGAINFSSVSSVDFNAGGHTIRFEASVIGPDNEAHIDFGP